MTENYEDVNHLVLNFYPDGYSIAVKLIEFPVFTSETILETAKISYEETGLLDYIANEELPPLLVEMIDNSPKLSQYKIWRDGCLVLEVRDKIEPPHPYTIASTVEESHNHSRSCDGNQEHYHDRSQSTAGASHLIQENPSLAPERSYNPASKHHNHTYSHHYMNHHNGTDSPQDSNSDDFGARDSRNFFVLLKPTNLSMLYDVLNLTSSKCWSAQQRLQLESQIVLHNSPKLTLEPDVSNVQNGLHNGDNASVVRWSSCDNTALADTRPRKYSRLEVMNNNNNSNSNNNNKKTTSYKNRLKSIYLNRPIHVGQIETNGSQVGTHHPKMNNIYHNPRTLQTTTVAESVPPELTLQQFLADKRADKKKSLPIGLIPRFQRYKRVVNFK